jgi:hypothetical protein
MKEPTQRPETNWMVAKRLKQARVAAGYATAAQFARDHGINETSYQHHENGTRRITAETARAYEALLSLTPGSLLHSLLYGEQLPDEPGVPIVGYVTGPGNIFHFTDSRPESLKGPSATGRGLVAYRIVGNDLNPAYRDGEHILCKPLGRRKYRLSDLNGIDCVVRLEDGRILLRQIIAQSETTAALIAYSGPATLNQTLLDISPVEQVIRALPEHLLD